MDAVFVCNKCEHHLFIEIGEEFVAILKKLHIYPCPNCSTNRELNWRFLNVANSEVCKDDFNWIKKGE